MKIFADHRLFFVFALVVILSWIYSYKNYKSSNESLEFSKDVKQLLSFQEEIDKIREIVDDLTITEKQNYLKTQQENRNENIKFVEKFVEKKIFPCWSSHRSNSELKGGII